MESTDVSPTEKLRVLQLLNEHEGWAETLEEALKVEIEEEEYFSKQNFGKYYGWEWFKVHTQSQTLYKMVTEKLLDITLSTRSGTHFRVRDPKVVAEVVKVLDEPSAESSSPKSLPTDLFDTIVGHDNIKTIVRYAIEAEKPVHLLFSGPPASAKTLFLMELFRLPDSYYVIAQTSSQAGLANLLFNYQPKYLLIDEIDRLSGDHIGVLNSLMSTGIISESKFGKTRTMELSTKVFSAGIKVHLLPKDLLSRFTRIKFDSYTEEEFTVVSTKVLTSTEKIPGDLASVIAKAVWARNEELSDVRQVVQIARLCGGDEGKAKEILKVLKKQ